MKLIDKLKNYWWLATTMLVIFTGLISALWASFNAYHDFEDKYDNIINTTKTTQQMSLKSVIWNDNIPIVERASACDVYLSAGYNSMTKKECEVIIERAEEQGSFSYIEMENLYGKQ